METLALLAAVAVAGVVGVSGLGDAMGAAIADSAQGRGPTQPSTMAVSSQAGAGEILEWARAFGRGGRPAVTVAETETKVAPAAEVITHVAGVTPGQNSTLVAAARPETIFTRNLPARAPDASRLLSLNTANGAKAFTQARTRAMRQRIAELLEPADADVMAFQEVDHLSLRSGGRVNTALDTVARMPEHEAFGRFRRMDRRLSTERYGVRSRRGVTLEQRRDGARIYQTKRDGVLVFGRSTERAVAWKDRLRDGSVMDRVALSLQHFWNETLLRRPRYAAPYGTAMYVGPNYQFVDAYLEVLEPSVYSGRSKLGDRLSDGERATRNGLLREGYNAGGKKVEPRSAVVVIAKAPSGQERAFIGTHLAVNNPVERAAELKHLARLARHHADEGRDVAIMGDMNGHYDELVPYFEAAGLKRAAGSDIDQVWVSADKRVTDGVDFHTEDTSDHAVGATATIH